MTKVAVVGGGIIGLSIAWRAAQRGMSVTVADPEPGAGATHAAAGMLAPVSEVTFTEEPLLRLGLTALERWPEFAAEIGEELDRAGTIKVAFDGDDLAVLDDLAAFEESLGLKVERLGGRECRRLEPMLAPGVRGGLHAPDDAWVDPRRIVAALLRACSAAGVELLREEVTGLADDGGVRLAGGEVRAADEVVLAAGCRSGELTGLPVRPVKGQILRLGGPPGFLTKCVRGLVRGSSVYLVPRADGEIVVGATQEEMGFDRRVTAGGVWELLRDARELVPGVTELELVEARAGLRPGTPDNLPIVGRLRPGVLAATGHNRNGVLLAPLTADTVAEMLDGGRGAEMTASDPGRLQA